MQVPITSLARFSWADLSSGSRERGEGEGET